MALDWQQSVIGVRELLEALGVKWAVLGGVAANLYRRNSRISDDIDVLVDLGDTSMSQVAGEAKARGWTVRKLVEEGWLLRLDHVDYGPMDLIAVEMEYQAMALSRAVDTESPGGGSLRVLAPEDIIIHKLLAKRHKDDDDIEAILEAGHVLNWPYLEEWAEAWEEGERLARFKRAAERGAGGSQEPEGPIVPPDGL